jgi:hypothetical protein
MTRYNHHYTISCVTPNNTPQRVTKNQQEPKRAIERLVGVLAITCVCNVVFPSCRALLVWKLVKPEPRRGR